MAKSSKRVDIFYVFIGHKHLRDVRQCFLAAGGCLYEQYRMILIWRWCAQQPGLHHPLPTHPPPFEPHSTTQLWWTFYESKYLFHFISFVTFQQNKLYHFFFCVMMIKAILMKWPPPGTEIMRMQGENSRPRCNSRHFNQRRRCSGLLTADLSLTQDTTSEPPAGQWHDDTISGGPSSAAFVSVQIIIFRSDRISSVC